MPLRFAGFALCLFALSRSSLSTAATCSIPGFGETRILDPGNRPISIAVGDFNRDGKADVVFSGGNVVVLLGKGDGTFQPPTNYEAGASPVSIAIGDVNGDGHDDLVAASWPFLGKPGTVEVLLGKGDGTFQAALHSIVGGYPVYAVLGDFNGDGKLDVATGHGDSSIVAVLLGKGDGTFLPPANYRVPGTAESLTLGDFNGDGKTDLAAASQASGGVTGTISIFLGKGDGTFPAPMNYRSGQNPSSVVVDDFNGDGKPDVVTANFGSSNVSVLLGKGDGTFSPAANYVVGKNPLTLAAGDFNGDGTNDLAVVNGDAADGAVLVNKGDGTFRLTARFTGGTDPTDLAWGDFDGDGQRDLALAVEEGLSVLLNRCGANAPRLALDRNQTSLTLAWPAAFTNFVLESTQSLNPTNWQNATEAPIMTNSRWEVVAPLDSAQRYFRLRKP